MTPPPWLTVTGDPVPADLDGRDCRTRAALFTEAARALAFPDYFGRNWDAFADCLRDLDRSSLTVAHADELLADEDPRQLAILLDVLADASADGLTTTFLVRADREPELENRIAAALT
ncbi:Barstar (barnase inhibitor) [Actinomadura rubteroloni]|uniref:Barstar (Barnase inhibitor) n=1 Tax=Actinomadura rubteroloni TaxID=1926885 RepID=A0A2P4URT9_9ACTN|nr:barstar family protein [Actinomadura rubteroloni]POM27765.1 Barstar (barnase inhibitor) [Actinomadura rubteroloni]